jgi:hypothetical protein
MGMSEEKAPSEGVGQAPEEVDKQLPEWAQVILKIEAEVRAEMKKRHEREAHASSPVSEHLSQKEEEVVG